MTRRRQPPAAVKLAAIAAAIIALVSGLAACGGGSPPVQAPATDPAAVAVVTGDATSPAAIETPTIEALLNRAFDRNAGFAVVDAGGRPQLYATKLGGTFGNPDAKNAALAEQMSAAIRALDKVIPATSESDPWTAVSEAIGWLHDQGGGTLVVENSGLGTTGFLNYRQPGLLEADPAELVTFAQAHHEEPDATGIKVILLGTGWTAPRSRRSTPPNASTWSANGPRCSKPPGRKPASTRPRSPAQRRSAPQRSASSQPPRSSGIRRPAPAVPHSTPPSCTSSPAPHSFKIPPRPHRCCGTSLQSSKPTTGWPPSPGQPAPKAARRSTFRSAKNAPR